MESGDTVPTREQPISTPLLFHQSLQGDILSEPLWYDLTEQGSAFK